jgi:hypothetical protein
MIELNETKFAVDHKHNILAWNLLQQCSILSWGIVGIIANPKPKYWPISAIKDCSMNIFAANLNTSKSAREIFYYYSGHVTRKLRKLENTYERAALFVFILTVFAWRTIRLLERVRSKRKRQEFKEFLSENLKKDVEDQCVHWKVSSKWT